MLIVDYKKCLTENDEKPWKISIFGNFSPLRAVKDINIFEKLFDFFKAHIKRQLLIALPYQGSNFNVLAMAFTPQPTKAEVWQQSHTSTQFHAFSGDPLEQNLQPTFKLPLHTILLKSHLIGDKTI